MNHRRAVWVGRIDLASESVHRELEVLFWLTVPGALLAVAFPGQRLLDALLLARFQIECVPLDFLNDVLLQDFALKAFERTLQAFAIVNLNFSQWNFPPALGIRRG